MTTADVEAKEAPNTISLHTLTLENHTAATHEIVQLQLKPCLALTMTRWSGG